MNRRLAVGVGTAVVLLAAIDAYVVVTVLVTMVGDLGVPVNNLNEASLVVTAFLLGYVAAMPLLGRLSDRFGRRIMLEGCLAVFAAGSLVTALAGDLPTLVAGRAVQGVAGGALLPITMALVGDLWAERSAVLGGVGAAQEMGSVLGPLYGAGIAAAIGWRGIFWINIPIALVAIALVHFSVPSAPGKPRARIDFTGGALLAAGLGLIVVGLYNPNPQATLLPSWGVPCLIAAAVVLVAFAVWEKISRTHLIDLSGARRGNLFAVLVVSFLSGAALMITLVDVQLTAQTLLGRTSTGGAFLLLRFLLPLAVCAVLGGLAARWMAERWIVAIGMLIAAMGYAEVSSLSNSTMGLALGASGAGLGLVIAPLSNAALRSVPSSEHGVTSATVVVARMMGMLIGVAALSAWGFHRFQTLTAHLYMPLPFGMSQAKFAIRYAAYKAAVKAALHTEYSQIFLVTAVLCVPAAVLALGIGSRMARGSGAEDHVEVVGNRSL